MADAPAFDCAAPVTAAPSGDGASYEFDVAALGDDGSLAVAILPTTPTDRVVLSSPGAGSLVTSGAEAAGSGGGGGAAPAREARTENDGAGAATPVPAPSGSSGATSTPRPVASAPSVPTTAAPAPPAVGAAAGAGAPAGASTGAAPATPERSSSGTSWLPPVIFVGLAALAGALWLGRGAGDGAVNAPQPA
jgi:hypothetical protein